MIEPSSGSKNELNISNGWAKMCGTLIFGIEKMHQLCTVSLYAG